MREYLPPEEERIQLGGDNFYTKYRWAPDRELNPRFADVPDVEWAGILWYHKKPNGEWCSGAVNFDDPTMRLVFPSQTRWRVISLDPLTISPSVLCTVGGCGRHGFIQQGKWVAC